MKPFKKGEHVIAAPTVYNRDKTILNLIVLSVGSMYISCSDENRPNNQPLKFHRDTLILKDFSYYELYHSIEDYNKEIKRKELLKDFESKILKTLSFEELELFIKIHNDGIEHYIVNKI